MAFMTVKKGGTTITLEIEVESARELEAEVIGSTSRAFDGSFRGDKEEFRGWSFIATNLTQDDYEDLRDMVKNDAAVEIDGDAFGDLAAFDGIVQLGEAPFVDDVRQTEGFSRSVALTVKQG